MKKMTAAQRHALKKYITIPDYIIYEVIDNIPVYYKNYIDVLNKEKTLDDIMGCSSLQSLIIKELLRYLFLNIEPIGFEVYTNETGLHIDKGNNLASDIAVFKAEDLKDYSHDNHYFKIPPHIVLEVDIKADLGNRSSESYMMHKTKKLHEWGVAKVIWVFSANQQIIIAEPNKDWIIRDWNKPFEVMKGYDINLGKILSDKIS